MTDTAPTNRPATDVAPTNPAGTAALPQALIDAMKRVGQDVAQVTVYEVPEYVPVEMEALCYQPSTRPDCEGESPLVVVLHTSVFPDEKKFKRSVGYFRAECATEAGDLIAFTHYLYSEKTGEKGPLADFVLSARVPFALRIARMKTASGFHVYRPIAAITTGGDEAA